MQDEKKKTKEDCFVESWLKSYPGWDKSNYPTNTIQNIWFDYGWKGR